ncbi:serine/threonine protein kinase [Micromonospora sp. ATCC 39149]|nr:serine/threonine protein kinase [Micromonospora sp. ATCC 39149]
MRLVPGTGRQADWTTMSPFTPTLRLHDRYVLRERIGLGGMSEVWYADDEVLHRPVAVKALAAQLAADPHLRVTIQREARAAARLTHPHVTQVYDYGEATLGGGAVVPYLVMELVEGRNLADRLTTGPLPWPEAVRLAGQIAGALAAAHRIGVVHRDIKPANVMLTETGAKVLDFGIAALAGPHHPRAGQTGELMMGTPAYFAPERLTPGPPNPASDVYALGVLLYRVLAGRAPLPVQSWEDAFEVHAGHRQAPPLRVPGLPPDIAALTLACLTTDPTRRPTAAQLARRLGSTPAAESPAETQPATTPTPTHSPTLVDRARPWAAPGRPSAPAPTAGQPRTDRPPTAPYVSDPAGLLAAAGADALPSARRSTNAPSVPRFASSPPAARASRSRTPGNRLLNVLVAAGVVLLVGLVTLLALDSGSPTSPAGAPGTAAPAAAPTTTRAVGPARTAPPTTARPRPVTLRQLAVEFTALIDEAQARGEIDRETADELREEAAKLNRGKLKDRSKRLRELREDVAEAVERDRLDAETGARLQDLLTGYAGARGDTAG